jgi:pyrrolysine biosynthesis protein PylC
MDIEVILDNDTLRVLEIDARLPSQTPITVLTSTGVNILQLLAERHCRPPHDGPSIFADQRGVVYEHIRVKDNTLTVTGEHAMASAGPLHLVKNFFGADEAITCQSNHRRDWVATLIISAENRTAAWERRKSIIADIMRFFKLDTYRDLTPIDHKGDRQLLKLKGSFR